MEIYTTPDAQHVLDALTTVMDESYAKAHIFPWIANDIADKELVRPGIVLGVTIAIVARCKELDLPDMAARVLMMSADEFADAICEVSAVGETKR